MQYRIFGGLVVERDGEPVDLGGRKQRAVLAALLLEANRAVPTDRLVEQVWGDAAPPRAEASLQAYVSKLRRLLEPDHRPGRTYSVLVTDPGGYRLVADRTDCDVMRFEDLLATAGAALTGGDPAGAAGHYVSALALYGPLLPELAGEPWVVEAAARLDLAHADALEGAFEARLTLGEGRELIAGLEAAVAAHPFRERLRGLLALALYRTGRQTDALRSLADARRTLADEIGVEPGPGLRELEADILRHATHLLGQEPGPRPAPPVPRPGAAPTGQVGPVRRVGQPGQVGLVGRDDELRSLIEAAHLAAAGEGRAVVIYGEPGIGKTRLVEELVEMLGTEVATVAWARCLESASSAPFWGYTQIAEQLLAAGVISSTARDGLSEVGGGVHTIDPAADRLVLYSSMVAALRSSTLPLLIVVDDLQWADASSLRVLEFVAGALASLPVLLVATVRPVGPDAPPPLVACLAELARQAGARHVDLHGLSEAEVATWLRRRRADVVADEIARFVHERTGGNPFFVGELVELLAREDRLADGAAARGAGVPTAALDVVRRRVSLLPGRTQRFLATASVLGVSIDLDVLAHIAAVPVAEVLDTLDPATEVGLLVEDRSSPGRLRFTHALVADALAAELSLGRRARMHAAVVTAIETLRSASLDDHLPALLHHAREGALAGSAPQAFGYAVRAARRADDGVAFEAAAAYWEEARQLLDLAHPGDRQARYDVLVGLGTARMRADDMSGSQDALLEAIAVAEELADPEAMRRAAGALVASTTWASSPYGEVNQRLVAALEAVLAGLEDDPTPERAGLVGALADAVYYERDPDRCIRLSAQAVDIARRTGDPATLGRALNQQYRALWRDMSVPQQEDIAEEAVEVAGRSPVGPALGALAHLTRAVVAMQRADRATAELDLARARALADQSHLPGLLTQVGWAEAAWLLALGRYEEAGERAREAHRIYSRTRGWEADDILASFDLAIAHDRGALPDLPDLPDLGSTIVAGRFGLVGRELLAWMCTENGQLERARALVGRVGSVPDPPFDWLWFEVTTAVALVRAALEDRAACAILYDRLSPFSGRLDPATGPYLGGPDLALARLAETLGERAAALRHVDTAVELLERIGTRPALARALLTRGRLLAAAGDEAAGAVLQRTGAIAREIGLVPVITALDAIQAGSKRDSSHARP